MANEERNLDIQLKESNSKAIYIFGEINENISREVVSDIVETNWDKDNIKTINIFICSEGGNLSDCFAIIDTIELLKESKGIIVITHGLGEVVSAGFFLFLLGDIRILYPSCRVFVHEHITIGAECQTYGERIKQDKTEERRIYKMYVDYIARRLNITGKRAKNLVAKNDWLTRAQLTEYNVIPKEVKEEEPNE